MNYGYLPGLKQSVKKVTFDLSIPHKIDFVSVDSMLSSVFKFDLERFQSNPEYNFELALIERVLLLANFLHSSVGMPAFEIGQIINYKLLYTNKKEQKLVFTAYIPHVTHVLEENRKTAYKLSINILQVFLAENTNSFYLLLDKIHKSFINPVRKYSNHGNTTIPLLEQAFFEDIPFFKLTRSVYQLGWGVKSILIDRSTVDKDSSIGARSTGNKLDTIDALTYAGIPTPNTFFIYNEQTLLYYAKKMGWPVVIKPSNCARSEGVTVNITNKKALIKAYEYAKKYSKNILIENHIIGDVYRIGLINNELIVAGKRMPKGVKGDGTQNIEILIDKANEIESTKAPWLRYKPFPKDDKAIKCLFKQGYNLQSVLKKDTYAFLRDTQNLEEGGVSEQWIDKIHPENVNLVKKISKLFRLSSIGVDIVSTGIDKPWYINDAKVIEVNSSPGLGNSAQPWGNKRLKTFLNLCFSDTSRIPISIYIGGDKALIEGKKYLKTLNNIKTKSYLVNQDVAFNSDGREIFMTSKGFYQRCEALLTDSQLEHLIVVIQTDEFLNRGLPFDRITSLNVIDEKVFRGNSKKLLTKKQFTIFIDFLSKYMKLENTLE